MRRKRHDASVSAAPVRGAVRLPRHDDGSGRERVGDEGTALREASLGRKFGMDFYVDQNIVEKTTGEGASAVTYTPALAFHKNAIALVTRPLELPLGASQSAIVNYDGFGLRVVYGYDQNSKTDTISIDMLCGVKLIDKNLAAVISDERE